MEVDAETNVGSVVSFLTSTLMLTGNSVLLYAPSGSDTRSMTSCAPRSVKAGLPRRWPWLSIDSHSGPLKRLNVKALTSWSGSNTSSVSDVVNNSPMTASPNDHCSAIQDGR